MRGEQPSIREPVARKVESLARLEAVNIQPVVPIHLNRDWNLITRTILPLVGSPLLQSASIGACGWGQSACFGRYPIVGASGLNLRNPPMREPAPRDRCCG